MATDSFPMTPTLKPPYDITDGALARLRRLGALLTLIADHPRLDMPSHLVLRHDPNRQQPRLNFFPFIPSYNNAPDHKALLVEAFGELKPGQKLSDLVFARLLADLLGGAEGQTLHGFLCVLSQRDAKALRRAPVRTARWTARLSSVGATLNSNASTGLILERDKKTTSAHEVVDAAFQAFETDDAIAVLARIWTSHWTWR